MNTTTKKPKPSYGYYIVDIEKDGALPQPGDQYWSNGGNQWLDRDGDVNLKLCTYYQRRVPEIDGYRLLELDDEITPDTIFFMDGYINWDARDETCQSAGDMVRKIMEITDHPYIAFYAPIVEVNKCPKCGIASTNIDDCGEFGDPDCPYFEFDREEYGDDWHGKLELLTPDLTAENVEKIAALFPNCITESRDAEGKVKRAIDFDLLRQELSADLVEGPQERYRLDWPDKRAALVTSNTPIDKTLRPCPEESVDFETTENPD